MHSVGIAQAWENLFGKTLELQKNPSDWKAGGKKKRQQNDLLSCCKVQSDLTVKSKDGVNDVKLYCDL